MTASTPDLFDKVAVRAELNHYEGAQGRVALSTFNPGEHVQFRTDREGLDAAAEKVAEWDAQGRAGYVRYFTTVMPGVSGRGGASDSLALLALAADVDYGTVGHKTEHLPRPLPPDEESARRIVTEAGLPEPTEWTNSSGGLYPVWRLAEHWNLTRADIPDAEALSERLHRALEASAERLGWHYGYTGDLSRVLRIRGTVNRKAGIERPCRLLSDDGPFHFVEDLDRALPPLPAKPGAPKRERSEDDEETSGPFDALRSARPADILEPAGWEFVKTDHRGELWRRPGDPESEYSLVAFDDGAYVCHSTATELPTEVGLSAGDVFAYLHHHGDRSEATHDLIAAARGEDASGAALGLPGDVLATIAEMCAPPRAELVFEPGVLDAFNPVLRPKTVLTFQRFEDLAAEVDAEGPRTWLLRGLWPAGDYGVHAAEQKAQKTWNTVDLAVSVASGTPWLGAIPVDTPGPVIMFVGEGGRGNTVRRIRAVAVEKGVDPNGLDIYVCTRVPHLNNREHMEAFAGQVKQVRPALVTLDPLYLAARGANGADLYAMGEHLEGAQHICQGANAALWVVTHFNRKQGGGAGRITGAGPSEWGRVLATATVKTRKGGIAPKESDVTTKVQFIGGEIGDQTLMIHRRIWANNPDNLDSPLNTITSAEITEEDDENEDDGLLAGCAPATKAIYRALSTLGGARSNAEINDEIVASGAWEKPYTRATFTKAWDQLGDLVEEISDPRATDGTFRAGLHQVKQSEG